MAQTYNLTLMTYLINSALFSGAKQNWFLKKSCFLALSNWMNSLLVAKSVTVSYLVVTQIVQLALTKASNCSTCWRWKRGGNFVLLFYEQRVAKSWEKRYFCHGCLPPPLMSTFFFQKGQLTPQSMPICPFISLTPHFMVHWHCMSESLSSKSNCKAP